MALRMTAPAAALSARFSGFNAAAPAVAARPSAAGNACRSVTVCAKKGKDIRLMITLECTEQKATGVAGISRYTSEKVRGSALGVGLVGRVKPALRCAGVPCGTGFKYRRTASGRRAGRRQSLGGACTSAADAAARTAATLPAALS